MRDAIKDKIKTGVAIGVLAIILVGIAGCTSALNQLTGGQALQVRAYAYAFHQRVEALRAEKKNDNRVERYEQRHKRDAASMTVDNSTQNKGNLSGQNGTTTSYSVNAKQFSSKEDATTFYNDISVGFTAASNGSTLIKPGDNSYKQVTGRDPSVTNGAWKLDSVTSLTAQFSFIAQQDEFVTWGSASVLTK